jgi:hypothetical protein
MIVETTADWNSEKKMFRIHSPNTGSHKVQKKHTTFLKRTHSRSSFRVSKKVLAIFDLFFLAARTGFHKAWSPM